MTEIAMIVAGIVCLALAGLLMTTFRSREGKSHPVIALPGMEMGMPILLMILGLAGIILIAKAFGM